MTVVVMPDGTHVEMPEATAPKKGVDPLEEIGRYLPYWKGEQGFQEGLHEASQSTIEAAAHPIESGKKFVKSIPKALGTAASAVTHPIDTVSSLIAKARNLTPEQAGKLLGTGTISAATGAALGPVGEFLGPKVKSLLPKKAPTNPVVKRLANEGVVMTPGERGGKVSSRVEQQLARLPVAGDAIKGAKGKAIEQWNTARINEALKDAGANPVPKARTNPRDQLFHAKTEFNRRYNDVKSRMAVDVNHGGAQSLNSRLAQIKAITQTGVTGGTVDAKTAAIINDAIDTTIKRFGTSGKASGDTIKAIDEELRVKSEGLRRSQDNQQRLAGLAIDQARNEVKLVRDHQNPSLATELNGIDKGYRKYKDAALASRMSAKGGGNYTPAQKLRAVERRDKSKDKDAFSTGKAHGQVEAEEAEGVLGNQIADSGTPTGLALFDMLVHKPHLVAMIPVSAGMHVMYSQPVLRFLQNRALKTGAKAGPSKLPYAAGAAATQFQEQPQQ